MQCIFDSAELKGSARRRNLLKYLVEETLAGRADQLKGYSIALAVFDRDEDFDPAADPIVRLEAGRLRRSLDTYYANAGQDDLVRITIPKGSYGAHFTWKARYPPVGSFDRAAPDTPPPQASVETSPTASDTGGVRLPRLMIALAATAVLALAGLSSFWLRGDSPKVADARGPAVLVLPFEALDESENSRLFASSMAQDLISDLLRFPDLRLFSVQTSFRQDAMSDPVALGRDLAVSYIVGGNIQSVPGKLRLNARLADASTGQVLWSGSYDRAMIPNDLLGMRSELSSAVATALGEPYGVVNAVTVDRLAANDAPGMASYTCLLQAYEYRRTFENSLFSPALACLKDAVVEDPDYADAWAMLGWLHLFAAREEMVPAAEHPAHMALAYDAASRAVELDPGSQRGLEALAAIAFSKSDYAESERLQREAMALNPHDPETLAQLGWRLAVRGNWDEGLLFLNRAIERSADPPGWYFHMISVHDYLEGNYRAALAAADRSAKVGSAIGLSLAAISHARLGDMEAAKDDLAAMAEAWPLLARDPVAAYGNFQADDAIVAALVEGLRAAGWKSADK